MEAVLCPRCTQVSFADLAGGGPAPCARCGADLRPHPAAPDDAPARLTTSAPSGSHGPLDKRLAEQWDDRFSVHNLLVGLYLAAYGFAMSYLHDGEPQSGAEKVLATYENLNHLLWLLQQAVVATGAALFISGIGIRMRQPWSFPLAIGCVVVSLIAGAVFFAGFASVGNGSSLEKSVAKVYFIRENLDFLVGLVDGGGLLYYL